MPFEPGKITREHVQAAVNEIQRNNVELIPSTEWDVIIDGKPYPPKEIMKYAHKQMNGELFWNVTGGEATNRYLDGFGFLIRAKNKNADSIRKVIENYKKIMEESEFANPGEKWIFVQKYLHQPDPTSPNFVEELRNIKFNNFVYHLAAAVMNELLKKGELIRYKGFFLKLFQEDGNLESRIKTFMNDVNEIYRELHPEHNNSCHHDERTIATLLTLHNPDKYTFFMDTFYRELCKAMGVKPKSNKGEKYVHYLKYINEFINQYIIEDTELTDKVRELIPKDGYPDVNHLLLAQDIVYRMMNGSDKANYWLFQCNPDFYDIKGALNTGMPIKWRVVAHKDRIHQGDYVILWVSGSESGCYALAEVTSEVEKTTSEYWEQGFRKDNSPEQPDLMVEITIIYNLADKPILKSQLAGVKNLEGLKFGLQGTNFAATEKQYKALEILAGTLSRADVSQSSNVSKHYWIYTPGNNGDKWDEFHQQGIMAVGWDELGDLSQFDAKEDIEVELRKLSGQNQIKKINDALANWQFKHEINIGDIIIAKKGQTVLLGYGEVSSEFLYDPERVEYRKYRRVRWMRKSEWVMHPPHTLITKTLTDLTAYPIDLPGYKWYWEFFLDVMNGIDPPHEHNYPHNLILFGPPGTGKTYNTVNQAVAIIDGISESELKLKYPDRESLTARYRKLVDEGRVVFTTFHQSMCYEDFIEGIKPKTTANENIIYDVTDGIFKLLCRPHPIFPISIKSRNAEYKIVSISSDSINVQTSSSTLVCIPWGLYQELIDAISRELINVEDIVSNRDVSTKINSKYDKFYFGWGSVLYALCRSKMQFHTPSEPSVLIIDEINRGNVSQIFGELITLIEPDKRAGNPEALEVTLPYSKSKFSVPPNLYIIGTMNTADRSVEALDTALRRRFSFREMAPEYSLLANAKYEDISLGKLLETINLRIEGLLDKDHLIGHSYFLRVANGEISLKHVFFNEIIPLLQEYFYGNYGRLELVLGSGFVKSKQVYQTVYAQPSIDNDDFTDHIKFTLVRDYEMNDSVFLNSLHILLKDTDEI